MPHACLIVIERKKRIVPIPTVRLLVVGASALPFTIYQRLRARYEIDIFNCKQNVLRKLASQQYSALFIWSKNLDFPEVQRFVSTVRSTSPTHPIIVMSCHFSSLQRATLLRSGAKDCLSHDISLNELFAKIEVLLNSPESPAFSPLFSEGGFRFHFKNQTALYQNTVIPLNRKEAQLLNALLRRTNAIVTSQFLYDLIWGAGNPPASNSLEVYMSSLRRKIEKPFGLKLFETVKGVGYRVRSG